MANVVLRIELASGQITRTIEVPYCLEDGPEMDMWIDGYLLLEYPQQIKHWEYVN